MAESAEVCSEERLRASPISSDIGSGEGGGTISKLKDRLQKRYEAAYPSLANIISHVIDQEEANARNLSSSFPYLLLPGLVEIHMDKVGLELPLKQPVFRSAPFSLLSNEVQLRCSDNFCEELTSTLPRIFRPRGLHLF